LTFNNASGVWTFQDAATTTNNLNILAGTSSSAYDMKVLGGGVQGNGVLNWTSGTFLVDGTGYFGGSSDWTFNDLTFGDGSGAATTTATSTNSITVNGDLSVATSQIFTGSKSFSIYGGDATGNGTLNLTGGTFLLDGNGSFGGTSNWTFYNLTFGNGSGSETTNATSSNNITVTNILTISANQT
jgi:hypothetical protein